MLKDIFKENILTSPWPLYIDDFFFDGTKITKSPTCDNSCLNEKQSEEIYKCKHGLSHISKIIGGSRLVISGVYICSSNSKKPFKKHKPQKTSITAINKWLSEIESKLSSINKLANKIAKDKFDQFHEFAKWANEINFYSNRLVNKSKNSQCSGFEAAPEDLKSLHKTSVMLLDSLDTRLIYFNPESASFGHKRATDIYSMLHKISLVLGHSKNNKGKIKIKINGRVQNKHSVYESFKIIPLSLLQNALKYRKSNDVEVHFEENGKDLTMNVISVGDLIPKDELPSLFDRGFRSTSALRSRIEGNGLGLYVASIVAKAHAFDLSVKSEILAGKGLAKNTFTVRIN
ncbi:sensor histidine kinase [Paraneptunicella aestuarii]|uniref:ATP-binding protein n=1 Tax=Paraneptunicella aestuarii TaxID=2831148 RepID=UPI001E33D70A|nr:ATP-binding protein [Paraneptunicella aestuarii]UAA38665.1 sensor histidine kinase [Paraneptunicella aestuarii]